MPAGKRSDALFCSEACKGEDYRNLEKAQRLEAKANRPACQHCGCAIPAEAQARRMFCSKHCQKLGIYHRKKLARGRICVICHGAYLAADDGQKTCSLKCSLETKRLPDPIDCKQCSARIDAPLPKQVFCGRGCAIIWHNRDGRRARSPGASAKDPPHCGNSP